MREWLEHSAHPSPPPPQIPEHFHLRGSSSLACRQALRALWRRSSLEFEELLRKCGWEMLIDEDDISNDVIILGTCFSMFVFIWQLSLRGATGELGVEFKFQRRSWKLSFHFPPRRQRVPADSTFPTFVKKKKTPHQDHDRVGPRCVRFFKKVTTESVSSVRRCFNESI